MGRVPDENVAPLGWSSFHLFTSKSLAEGTRLKQPPPPPIE